MVDHWPACHITKQVIEVYLRKDLEKSFIIILIYNYASNLF